jgi:hypothetical protein
MLRKLWCFAATAALVGAGIVHLTANYADKHPNSWPDRCLVSAYHVATFDATTVETTRHTAVFALRGLHGLWGTAGPGAVCEEANRCVAEHEQPAQEAAVCEPAILPGGFIHEEECDQLPLPRAMPPVPDLVNGQPAGGAEECEGIPMPRVEDEAAKMPPAEVESLPLPGHSVCPHHGGCPCMPSHTKGHQAPGGTEECEPVVPKLRRDGGERAKHPDVDTMEIRPSDLWFLDFIGPF